MLKIKKLFPTLAIVGAMIPGLVVGATPTISDLESQQDAIQQEINSYESQLVDVLAQISVLESEIAQKEAEIADTEANLADAQIAAENQFNQMCLRIRYNYENRDENVFSLILTAQSFSDFLNQLEYANSIYEYDNLMLDSYEATVIEIENLKIYLETQRADLRIKEGQLSEKRNSLNTILADARARKVDVDSQLVAAREEAARRAAEEAARRAAEEAARRAAANQASANQSAGGVTNANPAPVTDVSGSAVINYANQFVGNKYVWGGNSLTNGVDCSGFVVQIYKHFGIDLSGSRHTSLLEKVGRAVSYENMQPGDIVCYEGHVGLYTGAGTIVEAQSSRAGITNNRSVNNRTIKAIRRVI